MSDVTRLLEAANRGDQHAAAELLPLVYDELRRLASAKMASERPGQTLDATALVHEAYLRLVGDQHFNGRRHFLGAAAEAMRRILVEIARRKARLKHGVGANRVELPDNVPDPAAPVEDVLAVNEALDRLAARDATAAELVKLHYFAGMTIEAAADLLGVPHRTAYRDWAFARAWLAQTLGDPNGRSP
jgi:RNA polymerase sigma factor (TIGR02999 family)